MRRKIAFLLAVFLSFSLAACGADNSASAPKTDAPADSQEETSAAEENDALVSEETQTSGSNVLIAYFSVPEDVDTTDAIAGASIVVRDGEKLGNTEYVAELIQDTVGGDLFRIETVEEYPLDHDPLVDQAADEQDADARPELSAHVENFEQYEYVFLGFPNWWGDMPMAVYSFLEEYDFGAKTIIPFITHGGSGASRTVETISELLPGALMMGNELVLSRNDVAERMFAARMGFVGSAVATACSNFASVLLFLIIFYRLRGKTALSLSIRNFSMKFARPVFSVGIASAMMTVLANASNMVIVKLASGYGDIPVAAYGIVKRIDLLPSDAGDGKRNTGNFYDGMPSGTFEHSLPYSYELDRGTVWNDLDTAYY